MLKYALQAVIGVAILLILMLKLVSNLRNLTIQFNLSLFFLSILAYTMLNLILSFRIFYLIEMMGVKVDYSRVLLSHLGGMVVGDVTPGRSGYLLTPKILDKLTECGIDKGLAAIVTPQGIEFVLKALGALIAIVYLFTKSNLSREFYYVFLLAILIVLLGGALFLVLSWSKEEKSKSLIEKLPYFGKYSYILLEFKNSSIKIKKLLPQIFALYMAGWIVSGLQWYFIGKSININLSFVDFFFLHPLISTLTFVPLTPAGLGIMESGSILVFYFLGIDPSLAFVFSILARLSNIIGDLPGLMIFARKLVD